MIRIFIIGVWLVMAALPAHALTFGEWCGDNGIAVNPAGDPDGDGILNLMEYALADLDPNRVDGAEALPKIVYGTRATNTVIPWRDLSVIVATNVTMPPKTGYWHIGLRYKPRADIEGVRWRPQYSWWSANLGYWLDGRAVFFPPVADGTNGHMITWMAGMFRAEKPAPSAWLRMRVEEAP